MKKLLSVCSIIAILFASMFMLSGCGIPKKKNNDDRKVVTNTDVENNTTSENNTSANTGANKTESKVTRNPVDFKNKDLYFFEIDGKKYNITNKLNDIKASGYTQSDKDTDQDVPSKRYLIGGGYFKNSDGRTAFSVTPINLTGETVKEGEATIGGFSMDKYYFENVKGNICICNGITIGTSEEDLVYIFGEPSEKDMREDYPNLGMIYKYKVGAYKYFEFELDKTTKKITKITWRYFDL